MKHKRKTKEDKNLVYIEKIDENESSFTVACKVLSMYEKEYNLTLSEIASILKCEKQWVTKYVKDNVKHIFLNDRYRVFLMEIAREYSLTKETLYLKDYYYFSRKDFFRWLKENTIATKQTQRLDINIFSADISEFKRKTFEYTEALKEAKNSITIGMAMIKYEENIKKTLTLTGKSIFEKRLGVLKRKKTKEVIVEDFELPEKFVSIKELKNLYDKSMEIVYRDLYKHGAVKYTIAGSLVRYDESFAFKNHEQSECPYIITIPYEYYLTLKGVVKNERNIFRKL